MAVNVVLNGVIFEIPEPGDNTWGQELTDYFVALGSGVLQKAGGAFTLTAEVNFGATYGLKSAYYKSRAASVSTTGILRLARAEFIGWLDTAGSSDLELGVNTSDQLTFNGNPIIPSTALTASRAVVTDSGGVLTVATTTAAEIGYVNGVTSSIQIQLNAKIATAGHSALSVIGRSANSSGDAADITAGTDGFVFRRSGTTLDFGLLVNANLDAAAAIAFSKLAALASARLLVGSAGNVATAVDVTGDVTISNAGVTAIGANKVADTMIRQSAGLSVIGRSANTTGNVADITAGTDNFVLRRSGTTLDFGLLVNANVDAAAAIAFSKLATLTSTNILVGSAGNVATSVAMSGDVTIGNTGVTAIGANKVTLAMMAQVATPSFLGRTSASTGNVESLTVTQATALLNAFVGDSGLGGTKGLVPAPAAGDAAALKFLKADGTWAAPAGAGDVVGPSSSHAGGLVLFDGTTGKLIKESTITQHNVLTSGANGTVGSVAPSTAFKVLASDGTDWVSNNQEGINNGSEGAGTSTLTISTNPNQITTLTAARTYTLPTTSIPAGYRLSITNLGDFAMTINASGGATVATLHIGTISLTSTQATPTTAAHWIINDIVSKTSFSSTWTFNGTGSPGTSGSQTTLLQRNKDMIRIYQSGPVATSGTTSTSLTSNTASPAAFWPGVQQSMAYNAVRNSSNGVAGAGEVIARTDGTFRLFRDAGSTAWTNASSCGFQEDFVGSYYAPL